MEWLGIIALVLVLILYIAIGIGIAYTVRRTRIARQQMLQFGGLFERTEQNQ